jgi:hypothetical protein
LCKKKHPHFERAVFQQKSSGEYFLLLLFTDELVIQEDICVTVQSSASGKIPPLNFRFWLNVNYVPGVVQEHLAINQLMILRQGQRVAGLVQ